MCKCRRGGVVLVSGSTQWDTSSWPVFHKIYCWQKRRHAAMFTYISRDTARVVLFMNSKYSTLFPVYKWQKTMCKVLVYKQKSKLTQ